MDQSEISALDITKHMDVKIVFAHPPVEKWLHFKKKNHRADSVNDLPERRYRYPNFWHDTGQDIREDYTEHQYGCRDPDI